MRDVDQVTGLVVSEAFRLYRRLGPGLLESVYETILASVLARHGLMVERQKPVPLVYDGIRFDEVCRLDLLVDARVIVELKSRERILPVHCKQLLTYLRILDQPVGLLINFGAPTFRDAVERVVNNYQIPRTARLELPPMEP